MDAPTLTLAASLFISPFISASGVDLEEAAPAALPAVASIGALAFGPDNTLFLGDNRAGLIHALDLGEREAFAGKAQIQLTDVEGNIAALLGADAKDVLIHDLAVDPVTQNVYLAVSDGRSLQTNSWHTANNIADADVLLRVTPAGQIEFVDFMEEARSVAALPNPAENVAHRWMPDVKLRSQAITDMAFVDGKLLVAGLSNEEFAAVMWQLPFPFEGEAKKVESTTLEIFHGAHGKYETSAPIRSFVPYDLAGEEHILAAYLCTPFVAFRASELADGEHVRGRTVAELGGGNYPVDMLLYQKNGEDRLLIANSNLPFMILKTKDIEAFEGEITAEPDTYLAGVPYEIRSGTGILQMDLLNEDFIVFIRRVQSGKLEMNSYPTERF